MPRPNFLCQRLAPRAPLYWADTLPGTWVSDRVSGTHSHQLCRDKFNKLQDRGKDARECPSARSTEASLAEGKWGRVLPALAALAPECPALPPWNLGARGPCSVGSQPRLPQDPESETSSSASA